MARKTGLENCAFCTRKIVLLVQDRQKNRALVDQLPAAGYNASIKSIANKVVPIDRAYLSVGIFLEGSWFDEKIV